MKRETNEQNEMSESNSRRCPRWNYKALLRAPLSAVMGAAVLVVAAPALPSTGAPDVVDEPPLTGESLVGTELIAASPEYVAGRPFDVVVVCTTAPGWHLYWRNPGDSGGAPRVQWHLPEGFTVGPLRFPVPTVHAASDEVTYILEGEFALAATITPPSGPDGLPATAAIRADVSWMVCKELCVLGRRSHELEVRRVESPQTGNHGDRAPDTAGRLKRLLSAHPVEARSLDLAARVDARAEGTELVISLPQIQAETAIFVPDHTPGVEYGTLVRETPEPGKAVLRVQLILKPQDSQGKSPRAAGVVILDPKATPPRGAEIDLPLPATPPTSSTRESADRHDHAESAR